MSEQSKAVARVTEERFPSLFRLAGAVAQTGTEDPDVVALSIMEKIASAETMEEAFAAGQTVDARDLLNVALEVTDVHWNPSSFEGGLGVYAVVDAKRLDTGEPVTVTGGGQKPMTLLMKAKQLGALPMRVRWTKSERQTARGYDVLNLVPATGDF